MGHKACLKVDLEMEKFFHSVTLDKEACKGCTNCIKRCPTEAIRVREGKAKILSDRCIDCGECIRVCPHRAKRAIFDHLDILDGYKYKIALPAPSLYAQFNNLDDVEIVLAALLKIGFDSVFEVSRAAEIVSDATRKLLASGTLKRPVISSACPTVTRLIRVRFPDLIDNVLPLLAPVEVAARLAKKETAAKIGLSTEEIGAFFISPCPAKVTSVKMPLGTKKSYIDGVLAISDIYSKLLAQMDSDVPDTVTGTSGRIGIGWGASGGESAAILDDSFLACDGIENVIKVLEDLEDDKFKNLTFVELNACAGGCVGGVLTVENPYIAKAKLKRLRKYLPVSCNSMGEVLPPDISFDEKLEYEPVMELDSDLTLAMEKLERIREVTESFQGIDCGACGAPSCRALAEDVVRGYASADDCVFSLSERMRSIATSLAEVSVKIPEKFKAKHD